jgi:hypothetical protein
MHRASAASSSAPRCTFRPTPRRFVRVRTAGNHAACRPSGRCPPTSRSLCTTAASRPAKRNSSASAPRAPPSARLRCPRLASACQRSRRGRCAFSFPSQSATRAGHASMVRPCVAPGSRVAHQRPRPLCRGGASFCARLPRPPIVLAPAGGDERRVVGQRPPSASARRFHQQCRASALWRQRDWRACAARHSSVRPREQVDLNSTHVDYTYGEAEPLPRCQLR